MNPILAEDIMRQRAHRSVIVLATLLAWLLVTPDRASAEGITVIVPVNMTNFHEDVERVFVQVRLKQGSQIVGENNAGAAVVDGSVQEDVEVSITQPSSGENIFDADVFVISLILKVSGNSVYPSGFFCRAKVK